MARSKVLGSLTVGQAQILLDLERLGIAASAVALGSRRNSHHLRSLRSLESKGFVSPTEEGEYGLTAEGRAELRLLRDVGNLSEIRLQGGAEVRTELLNARGLATVGEDLPRPRKKQA